MKRIIMTSFFYKTIFTGLLVFFTYFLVWSDIGVFRYCAVKKQIEVRRQEFLVLKGEVKKIEEKIVCWKSNPFNLEKMAREELGMGYPDEVIYFYRS